MPEVSGTYDELITRAARLDIDGVSWWGRIGRRPPRDADRAASREGSRARRAITCDTARSSPGLGLLRRSRASGLRGRLVRESDSRQRAGVLCSGLARSRAPHGRVSRGHRIMSVAWSVTGPSVALNTDAEPTGAPRESHFPRREGVISPSEACADQGPWPRLRER